MITPKVALIHDHLVQYGGAEKTLETIMEIFPEAPVYTGIYNPNKMPKSITGKNIIHSNNVFLHKLPKYFSFLMPLVFENIDLSKYDIILSDSSCWAKGVLTKPSQLHISYIHTPPRFLYKYSVESEIRKKRLFKPAISIIDLILRNWDFTAAQRPNYLIANSNEVKNRISKFYSRDSHIINPPVDIEYNSELTNPSEGKYYIAWGRLVSYKNFLPLVKSFNINGLPLVIAGTGPEENKLKSIAKDNVKFTGWVEDEEKNKLIKESKGVINAVEDEDFGMVPVEAMSYGKPVLAHKSGGHLETITEGVNGMFFESLKPEELSNRIIQFDKMINEETFNAEDIRRETMKYSKERFKEEYKSYVMEKWEVHQKQY